MINWSFFQLENDSNQLSVVREKYIKMDNSHKTIEERCRKLLEELMETKGEVAKYKFVFIVIFGISRAV